MARVSAKPLPESIHKFFYYDESSPSCLRWKVTRLARIGNSDRMRLVVTKGDVAGHLRKDGYWTVKLFEESIKIHRIIYALHHPEEDITDIIIDHRNGDSSCNKIDNLLKSSDYKNGKNKSKYKNNSTGVNGIYLKTGNYAGSYVATYYTIDKKRRVKLFSISKLGDAEAFRLACEYREKMIAELNEQGAGYTERHGK